MTAVGFFAVHVGVTFAAITKVTAERKWNKTHLQALSDFSSTFVGNVAWNEANLAKGFTALNCFQWADDKLLVPECTHRKHLKNKLTKCHNFNKFILTKKFRSETLIQKIFFWFLYLCLVVHFVHYRSVHSRTPAWSWRSSILFLSSPCSACTGWWVVPTGDCSSKMRCWKRQTLFRFELLLPKTYMCMSFYLLNQS